jgi:NAD(P)-dependent dehydrogenase (short-subunit alcohol dehydrogenase family)
MYGRAMEALAGKHVVVTGATGGLGTAVVAALTERGAIVHAPPLTVHLDVEAEVVAYFAGLPDLWASIHTVGGFAMSKIADTSFAELEKQWRINTATCFLCCREAVRAIRKAGVAGGRIVNVAARPAVQPAPGMVAYAASKAAVASITQSLAAEVVAENILVNAVLPSMMDTPANRKAMPDADFTTWPKVGEVAEAILALISPANSLTSGALVPVYGRV